MGKWKTKDEHDNVLKLYNDGIRICDIVNITGLKRSCINNWVNKGSVIYSDKRHSELKFLEYREIKDKHEFYGMIKRLTKMDNHEEINACYSYLFGLYLGDGLCRNITRTHMLVYTMDNKYMDLIEYTKDSIYKLFNMYPKLCDKRNYKTQSNCFDIKIYSKSIRPFFPQGEEHGPKHLRKINIEQWQYDILNPLECLRGLIYSDGAFIKVGYRTFRYEFVNCSLDIINLFKYCCDKLNLRYNCHQKKTFHEKTKHLKYSISIAYQDDVRWLLRRIGHKNLINKNYNIKNSDGYYDYNNEFALNIYNDLYNNVKNEWQCNICKKECFTNEQDTYYLNNKLWLSINKKMNGMICLNCLNDILKMDIKLDDLKDDNANKYLNPKLRDLFLSN